MTDFTGKKYKLAGFDICQKGTLVDVFAKFCGIEQDPLNLPETYSSKLFKDSEPAEMRCIYPSISPEEIVDVLVGNRDTALSVVHSLRLPGGKEDLLADLGPENLALLLVEMGKAKRNYMQEIKEKEFRTFVPVPKAS